LARVAQGVLGTMLAIALWAGLDASRYSIAYGTAITGTVRLMMLTAIEHAVALYDPYSPIVAITGPPDQDAIRVGYRALDDLLPPGRHVTLDDGHVLTLVAATNEVIRETPFEFAYQPWSEPRLAELRRRYDLPNVVAGATNDFEELVMLRNWNRSQFRRKDYQPFSTHFDALEILTRNHRNDQDEPFSAAKHFDPCVLFPMLYIQLVVSMGHQARLMSVDHGIVEVWSNHYRKWVVMDAELNHHFERDGVPLGFTELTSEAQSPHPSRVRLVVGPQWSGDPSTTIVHLRVPQLDVQSVLPWFDRAADIAAMRNDWLTNRYFRGHPRRSERNSLILLDSRHSRLEYAVRARPTTRNEQHFNWTLNQAQVMVQPPRSRRLTVAFATRTPNFDHFELVLNGSVHTVRRSTLSWELAEGENTLSVAPVNQAGVKGISSFVRLHLSASP
jgi:hypothetical protein